MNNTLRVLETEDIIIKQEMYFNIDLLQKCKEVFQEMQDDMIIRGKWEDECWYGYHGLGGANEINFLFDQHKYSMHIGKEFRISSEKMRQMLRAYAIYCIGTYIFLTIQGRINIVKTFIENYNNPGYQIDDDDLSTIDDFLYFIATPEEQIISITHRIKIKKTKHGGQRKLAPVINYLAIENKISDLYSRQLSDADFIKWFPIFFWVHITFVIPTRPTEMLTTPLYCIERKGGKTILKLRKTKLKGRTRKVFYDVEKDYHLCDFEIPTDSNGQVAKTIEKYIQLTEKQERKFLFLHKKYSINKFFSLPQFNELLKEFINTFLIGNHQYDFVRYASNIDEFEMVTAGDSRHIAMANLYYQGVSLENIMQLAGHKNASTSFGYYGNVSSTIFGSAVFDYTRKMQQKTEKRTQAYETGKKNVVSLKKSLCLSRKQNVDGMDIRDCAEQHFLQDCMGCKYYRPSQEELEDYMTETKKAVDSSAKEMIDCLVKIGQIKGIELSLDEIALKTQTAAAQYKIGCDIKVQEEWNRWENDKNSQKNYC